MVLAQNAERNPDRLATLYIEIKRDLISRGFADEIDWQDQISIERITETDFLREAAWVIISSGMSEYVVRKIFPNISRAFFNWQSAKVIRRHKTTCRKNALLCFGHRAKIESIIFLVSYVADMGFKSVRDAVKDYGIDFLMQFPYLGPATAAHLAKNIGISIAKQDRHLKRISRLFGYSNPHDMCSAIAQTIDEKVSVIDLVFWRFATLQRDYLERLSLLFNQFDMLPIDSM